MQRCLQEHTSGLEKGVTLLTNVRFGYKLVFVDFHKCFIKNSLCFAERWNDKYMSLQEHVAVLEKMVMYMSMTDAHSDYTRFFVAALSQTQEIENSSRSLAR